ncbi:MAG: hypothetical protein IJB49_08665 [Clostridia bacterium]|nr:hypothetical protein [Clostridia bacterium]
MSSTPKPKRRILSKNPIGNPTKWRNATSMSWSARSLISQVLSDGSTVAYTYCRELRANATGLGKGWIKAKDLRVGDRLVMLNGKTVVVDSVARIILDESITVYNFEVEDFHTYFVGNDGFLVHNTCEPNKFTYAQASVIQRAKIANKNGISESEALALWNDAIDAGFQTGPRYHGPCYDSYGNGKIYHLKINNYHIEIG